MLVSHIVSWESVCHIDGIDVANGGEEVEEIQEIRS
jgi:hypothetical protein